MEKGYDLNEILNHIDPSQLNYQEWVNVGMALKEEGYSPADWENWSRRDAGRYHQGECLRKWRSFRGNGSPVTGGTLVQMAKDQGWVPPEREGGHELSWDDVIEQEKDELVVVDKNWIQGKEITEPVNWDPVRELSTYIETLFGADENVGYVTKVWERDGKKFPSKGCFDRTARQLLQALGKCKNGDLGNAVGDYDQEAGAWIRFNPLDGKDVRDENVTDYRHALIESDDLDLEKQNAIIRELELPVACLVYSGGKSLHAIVRVEAASYGEYRKRVDYLYKVCEKNGLKVDRQNRNPSRLSRMPGFIRNGKKQFLIDTNIGKASWQEWFEWIESVNDDLPEPEPLDGIWDNLPELSPPLIDGVLRQGHKMLLAGPSKAGKSFSLIELTIAIAEGRKWIGWQCAQGKVMYVNLELHRASCLHRFKDVYQAMNWQPRNLGNIDIWNLRGRSIPMDKLAPKLIRRAAKKDYIAIIIDPIYKVITGDENSADQMANFCNQFDLVCTQLGAAVIYCHHHSKGSQGGKRSMDRASGSGVFARDPDVLLDLIELEVPEAAYVNEENKAVCDACFECLNELYDDWEDDVSQDDMCSAYQMEAYCKKRLQRGEFEALKGKLEAARAKARATTAWRVEGTLREFPKFPPVNLWFRYPVHHVDSIGILNDLEPEADKPNWQTALEKRKEQAKKNKEKKLSAFEIEFANFEFEGREVQAQELADKLETSSRTILSWLGDGSKKKKELADRFEKYQGDDGKMYIRRKGQTGCAEP